MRLGVRLRKLDIMPAGDKDTVLSEILEQIYLVGKDDFDHIGCNIIKVLKKHQLVVEVSEEEAKKLK